MRKSLRWLGGASTVVALTLGADPALAEDPVVKASGRLTDLSAASDPTDGAHGRLIAVEPGDGSTRVVFVVTGLDRSAKGTTLGAHVHVGPCVAGDGAAAGAHYNTGQGGAPSPDNEVWLDFTISSGGTGVARAEAPFEIPPGQAKSVVIHAQPTQHGTGVAGPRLACLPVAF